MDVYISYLDDYNYCTYYILGKICISVCTNKITDGIGEYYFTTISPILLTFLHPSTLLSSTY